MVELETERKKVEEITAEMEEIKEREEQNNKDRQSKFSKIYEKNIGSKVWHFLFTFSIMNKYKFKYD